MSELKVDTISDKGGAFEHARMVQVVDVQDGAVATTTTVLPHDDTIPQNTEGEEFMTLAITPTNASNKLLIQVTAVVSSSVGNYITYALFQDSTAGALACLTHYENVATTPAPVTFSHYMTAGTVSSTTFKVRIGGTDAGTTTFNGQSTARRFGGVNASTITITEIRV